MYRNMTYNTIINRITWAISDNKHVMRFIVSHAIFLHEYFFCIFNDVQIAFFFTCAYICSILFYLASDYRQNKISTLFRYLYPISSVTIESVQSGQVSGIWLCSLLVEQELTTRIFKATGYLLILTQNSDRNDHWCHMLNAGRYSEKTEWKNWIRFLYVSSIS